MGEKLSHVSKNLVRCWEKILVLKFVERATKRTWLVSMVILTTLLIGVASLRSDVALSEVWCLTRLFVFPSVVQCFCSFHVLIVMESRACVKRSF